MNKRTLRTTQKLLEIVDAKRETLIDLTQALIRIPSVNNPPDGNERPCQEFLLKHLQEMEARTDLFTLDEVPDLRADSLYNAGRDTVKVKIPLNHTEMIY